MRIAIAAALALWFGIAGDKLAAALFAALAGCAVAGGEMSSRQCELCCRWYSGNREWPELRAVLFAANKFCGFSCSPYRDEGRAVCIHCVRMLYAWRPDNPRADNPHVCKCGACARDQHCYCGC